jgi:hypothetical protein
MRDITRSFALAVLTVAVVGCGDTTPTTAPPPDTRSAAEYFREQQAGTVTPHGRVLADTVGEADGRLEYATEDGRRWRVAYSKRADGTYRYGTPEPAPTPPRSGDPPPPRPAGAPADRP